jgi:hypothetical protein
MRGSGRRTWVRADVPAWYDCCGCKCGLLDLSKEVDGVLVERYISEWNEGEVFFGNVCVEDIDRIVFCCLWVDNLGIYVP